MDIFHPLATLHWERRHHSCSEHSKLVKNGDTLYLHDRLDSNNVSLTDITTWTTLLLPDVTQFALTTYQNQLVLVGGRRGDNILNEVWSSADGFNWQQSLPPMPTARRLPKATSSDNPECLVVAGGLGKEGRLLSVDVLVQGVWFTTQPVPVWPNYLKILRGNLFISISKTACYCPIKSLLAGMTLDSLMAGASMESVVAGENIQSIVAGVNVELLLGGVRSCWKEMKLATDSESNQNLVLLGNRMLVWAPSHDFHRMEVHAYSPLHHCWVHVQDWPREVSALLTLSPRKMVTISGVGLAEVTWKVSAYVPDSRFSKSALCRLEAAGIPVVTALERNRERLAVVTKVGRTSSYDDLMEKWMFGSRWSNQLPPTWRSLYHVLRELGLEELAREIEDYLTCPRSLREQCTSVIMSALLQSLEPDQLHTRLPDYVPTTLRQHLTDMLAPPPSLTP